MKNKKSLRHSPMGTLVLFMAAVILLMTGTIGGVRAAPQIFNLDFYYGKIGLEEIGITLLENGVPVSSRDYNQSKQSFDVTPAGGVGALLENLIPANERLKIGYEYPEVLSVLNSGVIPEYVRVEIYKYWVDEEGNKVDASVLSPDLIKLHYLENGVWTEDKNAATAERAVFYYSSVLNPNDSVNLTDTLTIDAKVLDYTQRTEELTEDGTVITTIWLANGNSFKIEAYAEGVQDHNAKAAMMNCWGLTSNDITRLKINAN